MFPCENLNKQIYLCVGLSKKKLLLSRTAFVRRVLYMLLSAHTVNVPAYEMKYFLYPIILFVFYTEQNNKLITVQTFLKNQMYYNTFKALAHSLRN